VSAVTAGQARFSHLDEALNLEAKMRDDKDLATEGAEDRVEGTADVVKGRIRNAVGGATGDSSEQLKGKAKELAGKGKQALGKAKEKLDPKPGVDEA
jgi:uncharacterized protein YjbJ (UPF0337 family)